MALSSPRLGDLLSFTHCPHKVSSCQIRGAWPFAREEVFVPRPVEQPKGAEALEAWMSVISSRKEMKRDEKRLRRSLLQPKSARRCSRRAYFQAA